MNARPQRFRSFAARPARPGFTLTEMLVVIGIIALLAALLLPATMNALSAARNGAMGAEINKLQSAIENYKLENGDYPPSFGDVTVVQRHIRKCFPKINQNHFDNFIQRLQMGTIDIDQSEALVFWLSGTVKNPILPFPGKLNPMMPDPNDRRPPAVYTSMTVSQDTNAPFRNYYDFDERRLEDPDGDGFYSFKPQYAKNTYYVYIDSRSYALHTYNATAMTAGTPARSESTSVVRPYFSDTKDTTSSFGYKFMNPNTYQLLCAGQDGEWSTPQTPNPSGTPKRGIIRFPSGMEYDDTPIYVEADYDNLANFSEGRTFKNAMP
jgi:prepilin-type N-terminal cleavage/methylation domain-containing protein